MDGWLGGNTDFINELKQKLAGIALKNQRIASFLDLVNLASVGFFTMAVATYGAAYLAPALLEAAPILERTVCLIMFLDLLPGGVLHILDHSTVSILSPLDLFILLCIVLA